MPPKAKISKEMIVNAALEIARLTGAENINARTVSQKLNCSTQPIMYHFKTIEDLKKATYQKADEYHTTYLSRIEGDNPMLGIGMAYIRFAADEPLLFRFLFQSNSFSGKSIVELIDDEALEPMLTIFSQGIQMDMIKTKEIFRILFLFVHGYASMLANNTISFDEESIANDLELVLDGAICMKQEGAK